MTMMAETCSECGETIHTPMFQSNCKCLVYKKQYDKYPHMTADAVKELWNDDRYSVEGLRNIALALLKAIGGNN